MSLSHVSLFAGVGGADLGMEAAGIDTVLACEIDKHARAVLGHRFPHATLHDDVRTLTGDDIRRAGAVPERTILSGGFPCQPFSVAGRRRGMGGEDERGDLYWEISRLLAEFPARWIVLENVPGLLSIDRGRTFGTILGDLADLGYGVAYRVLDAQFFGVPQRRRRIFIVGCLGDDRRPVEVLLEPEGSSGNPASRGQAGAGTAGGAGAGADRARVYGQHGYARYGDGVTTLTATNHKRAEDNIVVNSLTAPHGGADDNDAQARHLVPYVKGKRASTDQDDETWRNDEVAPTLNVFDNNSEARATVLGVMGSISHTLTAEGHDAGEDGTGRGTPIITVVPIAADALRGTGEALTPSADAMGRVRLRDPGFGVGEPGDPAQTLCAASPGAVAFHQTQDPINGPISPALGTTSLDMGVLAPAIASTLTAGTSTPGVNPPGRRQEDDTNIVATPAVRRLTPRECERLMGWPDDHTRYRLAPDGTPVEQADSHRYKQCGNGMAAPVVEWIARRIVEVDQ